MHAPFVSTRKQIASPKWEGTDVHIHIVLPVLKVTTPLATLRTVQRFYHRVRHTVEIPPYALPERVQRYFEAYESISSSQHRALEAKAGSNSDDPADESAGMKGLDWDSSGEASDGYLGDSGDNGNGNGKREDGDSFTEFDEHPHGSNNAAAHSHEYPKKFEVELECGDADVKLVGHDAMTAAAKSEALISIHVRALRGYCFQRDPDYDWESMNTDPKNRAMWARARSLPIFAEVELAADNIDLQGEMNPIAEFGHTLDPGVECFAGVSLVWSLQLHQLHRIRISQVAPHLGSHQGMHLQFQSLEFDAARQSKTSAESRRLVYVGETTVNIRHAGSSASSISRYRGVNYNVEGDVDILEADADPMTLAAFNIYIGYIKNKLLALQPGQNLSRASSKQDSGGSSDRTAQTKHYSLLVTLKVIKKFRNCCARRRLGKLTSWVSLRAQTCLS